MKTIVDVVSAMKNYVDNRDPSFNPAETTIDFTDIITVENAFPKAAKDIKLKVDAVQDLHGYDNPWVGGAGKNKLPLTVSRIKALNTNGTWNGNVYTYYGVTATINTDSNGNVTGIKCQGTSSNDECYVYLTDDSTLTFNDYKGMKLSGCNNGALGNYDLRVVYRDSSGKWLTSDEETTTAITLRDNVPNTAYYQIIIVVRNGKAVNETFYPMISTSEGTFESYTNICPISGWDNAKVTRSGKNLLPFPYLYNTQTQNGITFTVNSDGSVTANGTATDRADFVFFQSTVLKGFSSGILNGNPLPAAKATMFVQERGGSWTTYASAYDGNEARIPQIPSGTTVWVFLRIFIGAVLDNVTFYPMIRDASISDSAYEPYQGEELTISLGDTRYGGTLDVTSGVLTLDKMGFIKTEGTNIVEGIDSNADWLNVRIGIADILDTNPIRSKNTCSHCKFTFATANGEAHFYTLNDCVQLFLPKSTYPTVDSFILSLATTPFSFMGYLATPQTIQLTPAEVKLLQGYNTLYADSGDISLTYNPATLGNVVEEVGELEDLVSENQTLTNYTVNSGVKNLLPVSLSALKRLNAGGSWNGNACTIGGVTFTVNDNLSIALDGTSTATVAFILYNGTNPTDYNGKILSGFTGGSSGTGIRISDAITTSVYNYSGDTLITGLTATNQVAVIIRIDSGKTFNNQLVSPMIRDALITDPTYQPYAEPNATLTSQCHALANYVADIGVKNVYDIIALKKLSGRANSGITYSINDNGTVSVAAGTVSGTESVFPFGDGSIGIDSTNITNATHVKPNTKYIASFGINLGEPYYIQVYYKATSSSSWTKIVEGGSGTEVEFTVPSSFYDIWVRLNIYGNGTTVPAMTLKPMIREAGIGTDGSYQLYAKTNVELTSELTEVSDDVSYLSGYINANIDYETLHATISGGTATFTDVPTSDSTKRLDFYTSVPGLDYTNISVSGTTVTLTYEVRYNGQAAFCVISPLEHTF